MPFKVTESKIERKVTDFCRKAELYCRKFSSPSQRGVPDRVILGKGGELFLELKRPGNEPTPLQMREIRLIRKVGGNAMWSDDAETAIMAIQHYCMGKPQSVAVVTESLKVINTMKDDRVPEVKPKRTRKVTLGSQVARNLFGGKMNERQSQASELMAKIDAAHIDCRDWDKI